MINCNVCGGELSDEDDFNSNADRVWGCHFKCDPIWFPVKVEDDKQN
jgi:hypothetical protein